MRLASEAYITHDALQDSKPPHRTGNRLGWRFSTYFFILRATYEVSRSNVHSTFTCFSRSTLVLESSLREIQRPCDVTKGHGCLSRLQPGAPPSKLRLNIERVVWHVWLKAANRGLNVTCSLFFVRWPIKQSCSRWKSFLFIFGGGDLGPLKRCWKRCCSCSWRYLMRPLSLIWRPSRFKQWTATTFRVTNYGASGSSDFKLRLRDTEPQRSTTSTTLRAAGAAAEVGLSLTLVKDL